MDPTEPLQEETPLVLVRWKGGVWKVIVEHVTAQNTLTIRWVSGPRPDAGILHYVNCHELDSVLTPLEVIALAACDDVCL